MTNFFSIALKICNPISWLERELQIRSKLLGQSPRGGLEVNRASRLLEILISHEGHDL